MPNRLTGGHTGRTLRRLTMVVAGLALMAGPAAASGGLPQLNTTTFPTQLFWLAVSFIVLYVIMAKIALPGVAAVIDARTKKIDGDLQAAADAKDKAEAALVAYDKSLADARHEGQAVMKAAVDQIASNQLAREHDLSQKLAAQAAEADSRIAAATQSALANLRQVAAEAAIAATQRLAGVAVSEAEAGSVVDRLLEARR